MFCLFALGVGVVVRSSLLPAVFLALDIVVFCCCLSGFVGVALADGAGLFRFPLFGGLCVLAVVVVRGCVSVTSGVVVGDWVASVVVCRCVFGMSGVVTGDVPALVVVCG